MSVQGVTRSTRKSGCPVMHASAYSIHPARFARGDIQIASYWWDEKHNKAEQEQSSHDAHLLQAENKPAETNVAR